MRNLRLCTALLVLAAGCGTSSKQKQAPAAAPAEPVAVEADATTTAKAEPSAPPAEAGTPQISAEAKAQAADLLEQGRSIQREKGEGGAEEALTLYKKALEAYPDYPAALWEMGWSYQTLNQNGEALKVWDRLKEVQPDFPELDTYYPVLRMRHEQDEKLSSLPDPGSLPEPETEPYDGPSISFAAVGDIQTGRAWPPSRAVIPPNDAVGYYDGVKDWLQAADLTFGNLEQVLADDGESTKCGPKSTKCFAFRVPTVHGDMIKEAGFDILSIANNHAGDFGQAGRDATMKKLDDLGIAYSGPVGKIGTVTHNGLRVGLIAFSTGGGVYRVQDIETARRVVADVDREHDLVVVSFHGGAEGGKAVHVPKETETFYGENRGNVYEFAHALIDVGADLVLGHGPHVLRGMEIYKGRLIAYSLGNFSTYKTFNISNNLGWSTVLHATLAPNGVVLSARVNPVVIKDPGNPIKDPKKRAIKEIRRLSKSDFGDPIFDAKGEWKRPEEKREPLAQR